MNDDMINVYINLMSQQLNQLNNENLMLKIDNKQQRKIRKFESKHDEDLFFNFMKEKLEQVPLGYQLICHKYGVRRYEKITISQMAYKYGLTLNQVRRKIWKSTITMQTLM